MKLGRAVAYARRNHLALLALFVALGGTSYAAVQLPANSVGTRQLKAGAVTGAKIRSDAVTSAKLGNDAVTESEIADGAVTSNEVRDHTLTLQDLAFDSFRGERGVQGPEGPQGATGPRGATGAIGLQGPMGPVGNMVSGSAQLLGSEDVQAFEFPVLDLDPAFGVKESTGLITLTFAARLFIVATVVAENVDDQSTTVLCYPRLEGTTPVLHHGVDGSAVIPPGEQRTISSQAVYDTRDFRFVGQPVDVEVDCQADRANAAQVSQGHLMTWGLAR